MAAGVLQSTPVNSWGTRPATQEMPQHGRNGHNEHIRVAPPSQGVNQSCARRIPVQSFPHSPTLCLWSIAVGLPTVFLCLPPHPG
jgi:hypothetical protein